METALEDPTHGPRSSESGSSLLEVTLGTLAVVFALNAVISVVLSTANLRKLDAEINLAFVAARNNLEEVRNLPTEQLLLVDELGFDVPALNGAPGGLAPLEDDPDGLPGMLTVRVDQAGASTMLFRVRTTVTWTGVQGRQDFQLESLVSERRQP